MTTTRTRAQIAHGELRVGLAVRIALALVAAAGLLVLAWWLASEGIVDQHFPPYVAGVDGTVIVSYSGPRLAGAIGIGAVAGLLVVSAVTDLWRRALVGRTLADCRPNLGD